MADKKISALTSLAQGDVAVSTDVLPIVDTSATETKKVTAAALVGAGLAAGVTNVDINSGAIDGTTIGASSASAGTFTNLTASGTVSFSGATVSNGGSVTTVDINGGTIDGATIATSDITVGTGKTLNVSAGTLTLADNQISGDKVEGGTINAITINTLTATTVNTTTVDATNVEVTNVKAKDGTASIAIADSTGIVTVTAAPVVSALTASQAVFTTSGKALVSNAITGSGNVVMSASPTLTGTIDAAAQTLSGNLTLNGGTANGVLYLNGSKVATSGSALTFDGTNFATTGQIKSTLNGISFLASGSTGQNLLYTANNGTQEVRLGIASSNLPYVGTISNDPLGFLQNGSEQMRLTSTGLGIGTSSPGSRLEISAANPFFTIYNTNTGDNGITWESDAASGASRASLFVNYANAELRMTAGVAGNSYFQSFYTNGSERMRLDSSGNLGLGVTPSAWVSPFKNIQLGNGAGFTGRTDAMTAYMSSNWYYNVGDKYIGTGNATLYLQGSGQHVWYNAASGTAGDTITFTQAMTLDASGLLTVGNTSPAGSSQITAYGASNGQIAVQNSTNWSRLLQNSGDLYIDNGVGGSAGNIIFRNSSSTVERARITSDGAFVVNNAGGDAQIYFGGTSGSSRMYLARVSSDSILWNVSNGAMRFGTNDTERARITSGGDLLVGGTSAFNSAANRGNISVNGASTAIIAVGAAASRKGYLYTDGTNCELGADSALLFSTSGGSERARIDSSGNLLVGTTTATSVAGRSSRVNCVQSTNGDWAGGFIHSAATGTNAFGFAIYYSASSPNSVQNPFLYCEDSTTLRAEIRSNGGLANYQSNNADLSDARTKKNITPAASMWGKIGALEIVTYKYNDQTHDDVNLGVIAQQVEAVEPVWVDADGFGETPEGEEPLKTVYTKDITFAAIKALQEAMARIEQLEAKVTALESK